MPAGDNARRGPNGGVIGSGRTPKALQIKNYEKGLRLLDNNIEKALNVLIDGLEATKDIYDKNGNVVAKDVPDNYFRFNCACVLIKKVFPDKKSKEGSGPGGENQPNITVIDKRKTTIQVIDAIDSMDLDKIKEMQQTGELKLVKKDIEADYVIDDEETEQEIKEANAEVSEAIAGAVGREEEEVEGEDS